MALSQAQHTLRGNKELTDVVWMRLWPNAKSLHLSVIQNCVKSEVHACALSIVGSQSPLKNSGSHIDASHSRQPLVKGERLVRYEVNAVMLLVELLASLPGCTNRMW